MQRLKLAIGNFKIRLKNLLQKIPLKKPNLKILGFLAIILMLPLTITLAMNATNLHQFASQLTGSSPPTPVITCDGTVSFNNVPTGWYIYIWRNSDTELLITKNFSPLNHTFDSKGPYNYSWENNGAAINTSTFTIPACNSGSPTSHSFKVKGKVINPPFAAYDAAVVTAGIKGSPRIQHVLGYRVSKDVHNSSILSPTSGSASPATSLPSSVDLSPWAVPVGYQDQVGSCVSWAVIYGERGWYAKKDGNYPSGPNTNHGNGGFAPMYAYAQLAKGSDNGSYLSDNYNLEIQQGDDTRADYCSTISDCDTNYTSQPTANTKANAANFKYFSDYSYVDGSTTTGIMGLIGPQYVLKTALASGHPAVLGINVYPNFDSASYANPVVDVPTSGKSRGGHAVLAVGYDANGVWIENSWGTSWGRNGYAELTWDFVNKGYVSGISLGIPGKSGSGSNPLSPSCSISWNLPSSGTFLPSTTYNIGISPVNTNSTWNDVSVYADGIRQTGLSAQGSQYLLTLNSGSSVGAHTLTFVNNDYAAYGQTSGTGIRTVCSPSAVYNVAYDKGTTQPSPTPKPSCTSAGGTCRYATTCGTDTTVYGLGASDCASGSSAYVCCKALPTLTPTPIPAKPSCNGAGGTCTYGTCGTNVTVYGAGASDCASGSSAYVCCKAAAPICVITGRFECSGTLARICITDSSGTIRWSNGVDCATLGQYCIAGGTSYSTSSYCGNSCKAQGGACVYNSGGGCGGIGRSGHNGSCSDMGSNYVCCAP